MIKVTNKRKKLGDEDRIKVNYMQKNDNSDKKS